MAAGLARRATRLVAVLTAMFGFASAASAHTADISSSRIVPEGEGNYRVEVGFLATDIERAFADSKPDADVDLTEPGVIERMIGEFIRSRVELRNEGGDKCSSAVVSVGADPINPRDSKVVLRMDCSAVEGQILYDPFRLLEAQGRRAKHLVGMGEPIDKSKLRRGAARGRRAGAGSGDDLPRRCADRPFQASALPLAARAEILRRRRRAYRHRLRSFVLSHRRDAVGDARASRW